MKVSTCNPSPVLVLAPVVLQPSSTNQQIGAKQLEATKLHENQTAEQTTAMAYQALIQLFFADQGNHSGYLQKAKELAQLAEFHSLGLSGFSAKTANQLALQALAQIQQLQDNCTYTNGDGLNAQA